MNQRDALTADLELLLQRLFGLADSQGLNALAEVHLSWPQVRVMMLLACTEAQPIGSVADQLGVSIHSAGRTIDQLVELGIVDRHESPTDRRVKLVSLTARGLETIDQHRAHKRMALALFVERLPDSDVAALAGAIGPILAGDSLRPHPPSTEPSRL